MITLRPPAWEWSFLEDGALALDSHELWEEPELPRLEPVLQSPPARRRLKHLRTYATLPRMPSPRAPGASRRARDRRAARRLRKAAIATVVASALLVTLTLTAFSGSPEPVSATVEPAQTIGLVPDAQPHTQIVAVTGPLKLQLPVAQTNLTAVGYHAGASGALELEPVGRQGNRGFLRRLVDRIVGSNGGGLVYYLLEGGGAGATVLDVGAPPGTDVFSPVDGTVIGITDFVLDDEARGVRIDVQPASAPSLVVSLTRLRADPALTVGMSVAAGVSKLGAVLDLSAVEEQALARYTSDSGNHVSVEVRPAATLSLLP